MTDRPPRAIVLLRRAYDQAGSPPRLDLARRADVARATLHRYLCDDRPEAQLHAIDRTLRALGYTLDLRRLD
jgi:hypothetical protein